MVVHTSAGLLPAHKSYVQHCTRQQTAYPVASAPLHSRVGSEHRAGAPPSRSTPPPPAPPGGTPETRSQWRPPAVQRAATMFSSSQSPLAASRRMRRGPSGGPFATITLRVWQSRTRAPLEVAAAHLVYHGAQARVLVQDDLCHAGRGATQKIK